MGTAPVQPGFIPVSFHPDDCVAGGLINDVDVEVEHAEFTTEGPPDYPEQALFAKLSLKDIHSGDVNDQYWSCGKKALDNFTPTEDGRFLAPTGGSTQMIRSSNFITFMESLTAKGFPKTLCQDMGNLKGLQMHVVRVPLKVQAGMSAPKTERDRTVLVCERILKLPGEKAKRTPAARPREAQVIGAADVGTVPVQAAAPAAAPSADIEALAVEQLKALLSANGKTLELKAIRAKLYGAMKSRTDDRNAVIKLVTDTGWLESNGFAVEGTNVVLLD